MAHNGQQYKEQKSSTAEPSMFCLSLILPLTQHKTIGHRHDKMAQVCFSPAANTMLYALSNNEFNKQANKLLR
jgi:hypothetical protein